MVPSGRQQGLGMTGSPSGLQWGLGWLGSLQANDRGEQAPGTPRVYNGRQCPLGLNCSGALVTRAVGADDAGEPLEGTDDLAASPRLEILHEQQLKVPHGCPRRLSRFLVRQ